VANTGTLVIGLTDVIYLHIGKETAFTLLYVGYTFPLTVKPN